MKDVTLLKFDNFTPSLVFSKNFNLGNGYLQRKIFYLRSAMFSIFLTNSETNPRNLTPI